MAADWEDIKRLAADFQRAQLSSTTQRLSERNCVEIVQELTRLALINVIYTIDGKEYLTPQELCKEIKEELVVKGGRVNVVDLQQILNVDLTHIQAKVGEIVSSDPDVRLQLGQLIDKTYLDSIGEEIDDLLQESGQVTIADLTKKYNLPADFIYESVAERLATIVHGQIDSSDTNVIYTEAFVSRQKAKIRGLLTAVTRPTSVMGLINQLGVQEKYFYSIVEELIHGDQLRGTISGGRQDKALFVPAVYSEAQNAWVDNFFSQNGYLEYDALTRLGITDHKNFIKKRIKGSTVVYLSTCAAGGLILDQITAEVDEALATGSWIDVMPSLPSVFSKSDANQILQKCVSAKADCEIFDESIVVSRKFIQDCAKKFENLMATKADKDAKKNATVLLQAKATNLEGTDRKEDKKDSRRKKASAGKQGGGTQGRESKTKSVKKKYNTGGRGGGGQDDGEGEERAPPSHQIEFLSSEEILEELEKDKTLDRCPEEMLDELSQHLYRPLRGQYQEVAHSVFLQSVGTGSHSSMKKSHTQQAELISGLWVNAQLFDKANKLFPEEPRSLLNKHLLRTICSDITNHVFNMAATQRMMSIKEDTEMTPEVRLKVLGNLPDDDTKPLLTKIHTSLSGKSVDDFFKHLASVCANGQLEILLKKPDKKRERQLVFAHRQALMEQLKSEDDVAMSLHLAATLLFTLHTQTLVHAPGKCVPAVITFLEDFLTPEQHSLLRQCQDLVMKQMKQQQQLATAGEGDAGGDAEAEAGDLQREIQQLVPQLREMALTARRNQNTEETTS